MTNNPDYIKYTDLRVYDKDPEDIYDAALETIRSRIPDWEPRGTNIEVMLLEALAVEVSEAGFLIDRLPQVIMEALLAMAGVARNPGTPPTVEVEFTAQDDTGYVIPAGTEVSIPVGGDDEVLIFEVVDDIVIVESSYSATGILRAQEHTESANGVPASTEFEMMDDIYGIMDVVSTAPVSGGVDPESIESWFDRGVNFFRQLSATLVTPDNFVAYTLAQPGVRKAFALDNYNSEDTGDPGDHSGYLTLLVYGDGDYLTPEEKDIILASIDNRKMANLVVNLENPEVVPVNVTVEVVKVPNYSNEETIASVTAVLESYLDYQSWDWSTHVFRNRLISVISSAPGVALVSTLTTPSVDLELGDYAVLTTPGTITVTIDPGA